MATWHCAMHAVLIGCAIVVFLVALVLRRGSHNDDLSLALQNLVCLWPGIAQAPRGWLTAGSLEPGLL